VRPSNKTPLAHGIPTPPSPTYSISHPTGQAATNSSLLLFLCKSVTMQHFPLPQRPFRAGQPLPPLHSLDNPFPLICAGPHVANSRSWCDRGR